VLHLVFAVAIQAASAVSPNIPTVDERGLSFSVVPAHCFDLMTQDLVTLPYPGDTAYQHYLEANQFLEVGDLQGALDAMVTATNQVETEIQFLAQRFLLQWMRLNQLQRAAYDTVAQLIDRYGAADQAPSRIALRLEAVALNAAFRFPRSRNAETKDLLEVIQSELGSFAAQVTAADRARFWARLGDWWIYLGKRNPATTAYARAWSALADAGVDPASSFSVPAPLCPGPVFSRNLARSVERDQQVLEYVFEATIKADGQVSNVQLIENPHGSRGAMAARDTARYTLFRPAMAAGMPVETLKFRFRKVAFFDPDSVLKNTPLIVPVPPRD